MSSRITFLVIFLLALFTGAGGVSAQEAALSLMPETGVFPIGEEFTIEVQLSSGGSSVGTADATITFEPEDVSFVAVSDEGSVFSTLLVDSSRKEGEIDISGFMKRGEEPFVGEKGLFARVTFVPLRNVAAQFHFSKGAATAPLSLTASVGDLTNILTSLNTATYTFVPKENVPSAVYYASAQEEFEITPLPVPVDEWFATTSVKLSWTLPDTASEMRTVTTNTPSDIPSEMYQIPLSSVVVNDLVEGLNYFLLQFKFNGEWGSVIQYPLRIDLSDPDFIAIKEAERNDPTDPRVAFEIESSDAHSGISYFDMSIDGEPGEEWRKVTETDRYSPEGLSPGEHVLTATAYDKAGNSTSTDYVFLVSSLVPPTLTPESVPDRALTGDTITVRGTSYPNAEVTTYISLNDGEVTQKVVPTNEQGEFVVDITNGARAGKYTLWFSVKDERGAISPNSIRRSVEVTQPYIMMFGAQAVTYLSVIVPLLALIALLVLVVWLMVTWARGYRSRVRKETGDAYYTTREEFERLRNELIKQIGMLEKANLSRELTREEMRIFTELSKRLDKMEQHITDEIEDIEKFERTEQAVSNIKISTKKGSLNNYREKTTQEEKMYDDTHILRL